MLRHIDAGQICARTSRSRAAVCGADADADPSVEVIFGDCRDVMPLLPAGVFDGCVCDPPYGLGIADWDHEVPNPDFWREVCRLLKPGAVLAAFAARRLYHELASAVQAAGFRVVDMAVWIYQTGRPPSAQHLRPAHEPILIARAPGKPIQVGIDEARIPYRDQADRSQVQRIDPLRAAGHRRSVYHQSLNAYGREPFKPNDAGRWPTTIMATDDVLGEVSHVFRVPKVRNSGAHKCAKPVELMSQIVRLFVPEGGVVLDPFAGSGPVGEAAKTTGRKAVLIEMARAA
jgi:site-specific DNA-methyltransferase (adenine-specific)